LKNIYLLIVILLLVSCTTAPPEIPIRVNQTQIPIIDNTLPPSLTNTETQKPTVTVTPTHSSTATPTSTITLIPSETITPTQDLSFYDIAACIPKNTSFQIGTVTQVIDGDTIYVLLNDGRTVSVRYIGMDAPEEDRPFSLESYNANSTMVDQKEVILVKDVSETDQYDRLLRYVIVGDNFVNLEMVRSGFASAETYPPDTACGDSILSAEKEARAAMIGLWIATPTPIASNPQIIIVTVNKREEWVDIQNVGASDVDLAGWNLVSERGNQDCRLSGVITMGEKLRIWAMATQGSGFSCGYNTNIWNNSETDPAVLYNAQGVEVSRK
jgi:endonuclease YncB( thermonuclease family)